jgi:serine/threonine-protein kinase
MKPPDSGDGRAPKASGPTSDEDFDEIVRAVAHAPPQAPAPRTDFARARLGMVLRGKYRLDGVLGIGGMAVVYKATHRNQAEFAIKMLLPEHSMVEEIRTRFLREGYAANSVKHPGAVRVVDDDVSEEGTAFLVLELLRGAACDKLSADHGGRLPVEAACAVGLQVLDVLEAAHSKGIIHRDIKPANLFVQRDGAIKVFDFGIARVRETMSTGSHTTGSGMLLGTPAFMAPEQAMGKASDVDARADIWAVGATLFALMSGSTVHEGDTGRELLVKLISQPARSLSAVAPAVPSALGKVIDQALTVDREQRWPSAQAMRSALEEATSQLWGEPPGRAVLAALVASMVPASAVETTGAGKPTQAWGGPGVAPTMPVRQHSPVPQPPLVRAAVVETSTPVSRERSAPPGQRRSLALTVLAGLGALGALGAFFILRYQRATPEPPLPISTATVSAVSTALPVPAVPPVASIDATIARPAIADSATANRAAAAHIAGEKVSMSALAAKVASSKAAWSDAGASLLPAVSTAPPAATAEPQGSARPSCNPPFYYDSNYNRVFKKECL